MKAVLQPETAQGADSVWTVVHVICASVFRNRRSHALSEEPGGGSPIEARSDAPSEAVGAVGMQMCRTTVCFGWSWLKDYVQCEMPANVSHVSMSGPGGRRSEVQAVFHLPAERSRGVVRLAACGSGWMLTNLTIHHSVSARSGTQN